MKTANRQIHHVLDLSPDGYIRLPFVHFQPLHFEHLFSSLDIDNAHSNTAYHAHSTSITGYTEWICNTEPLISLGWDWEMGAQRGRVILTHSDDVRSNIMLQDHYGNDLGYSRTSGLIADWLDSFDWATRVISALQSPSSREAVPRH